MAPHRLHPPVSGGVDVVAPHISPRDDRQDEDDQGAVQERVGGGRVNISRSGPGQRDQLVQLAGGPELPRLVATRNLADELGCSDP